MLGSCVVEILPLLCCVQSIQCRFNSLNGVVVLFLNRLKGFVFRIQLLEVNSTSDKYQSQFCSFTILYPKLQLSAYHIFMNLIINADRIYTLNTCFKPHSQKTPFKLYSQLRMNDQDFFRHVNKGFDCGRLLSALWEGIICSLTAKVSFREVCSTNYLPNSACLAGPETQL